MHFFTPNNAVLFGQRATIQKGEAAKERIFFGDFFVIFRSVYLGF